MLHFVRYSPGRVKESRRGGDGEEYAKWLLSLIFFEQGKRQASCITPASALNGGGKEEEQMGWKRLWKRAALCACTRREMAYIVGCFGGVVCVRLGWCTKKGEHIFVRQRLMDFLLPPWR